MQLDPTAPLTSTPSSRPLRPSRPFPLYRLAITPSLLCSAHPKPPPAAALAPPPTLLLCFDPHFPPGLLPFPTSPDLSNPTSPLPHSPTPLPRQPRTAPRPACFPHPAPAAGRAPAAARGARGQLPGRRKAGLSAGRRDRAVINK